jgi:hypothetical protein
VTRAGSVRTAVAALVLVACLLAGQAVVVTRAPTFGSAQATVGKASFAYLTGLRRFAAMLLFNRIDPQHDTYYQNVPFGQQTFMLTDYNIIVLLDPQFIQAYYIGPQLLVDNDRLREALVLARQGVANNPDSGLLHGTLALILYAKTKDLAGAVREADIAMRPNQVWADYNEQWQALRFLEDIYTKARLPARAEQVRRVMAQLDRKDPNAPGVRDPNAQF